MATCGQINMDVLHDEVFDVLCSMCKNEGTLTESEMFCVDCNDYFCVKCASVHSKVPALVGHKVLDKTQVKSGIGKGIPRAPVERCDRHSHKHIDMYCQNHDNVGCSTCMAVDHRSCQDTFYIPEYIKKCTHQVAPRETQNKLKAIAKTLAEQANQYKVDKQRLQKRKAELLADIRKFRQEINVKLDRLEERSVKMIEDKFKLLEGKIEEEQKKLQANKARVTSAYDKLASQLVSPNQNESDIFVDVKMGEDAADIANKYVEDFEIKSVAHINFQPDKYILQQLEQKRKFGILTEKSENTLFQVVRGQGEQSYCVKVASDKDYCHINSACFMEDGTIILADKSNKKLKRLESCSFTVTDFCDLPEAPRQVCTINTNQVAVSLAAPQIHFISTENQMKTTNKINTDFKVFGLAFANNHLYISKDNTSVYVYTLSGQKLKHFHHDCLMYIYNLAVSKDASKIYVADAYEGLTVLDNNGKVVTTFKDKQLHWANSCYVTESCSVLVSGLNSVVQFSSNGELLGQVMKANEGKGRIRSVCCNHQMSKMCISRYYENDIEVYDI